MMKSEQNVLNAFMHAKKCFFVLLLLMINHFCYAEISPVNLRCEYQLQPLTIVIQQPRFSWELTSLQQNQVQTAYEIIVSTDKKDVDEFKGKDWTPGKIYSSNTNQISYQGKSLKPFQRYYWRVRVFDGSGNTSAWSEIAWFETAMMNQQDWSASWIDDGKPQFLKDEEFYQDDRMPLFKRVFTSGKQIQFARLYISGLGYYEAFLNGTKIGDHVLDPGWTTYSKEVLYSVYDVTSQIKSGQNILGVMLGNGWYNPLPLKLFSKFNIRDHQETGRPKLKAELHIYYQDGTLDKVLTDEQWLTAQGPIIRNNTYLGEKYDARLEQSDWHSIKSNPSIWKKAKLAIAPTGNLTSQNLPPVRVTKEISAKSIKEVKPGVFIVDMGQNFAGVVRIKIQSKKSTAVRIKYGEALNPDGSLNYLTSVAGQIKEIWNANGGPGAPATAWQEDVYITKGNGLEVWSPRFTFHGFRYVEISGWPGEMKLNNIAGLRMNSDLVRVGKFSCSNNLLNQLHEITQWTFMSNVFSVQSDCPGREKLGYGADMVVTANAYLYNYDMVNFYSKAVRDFANEQETDGGITETAPFVGIADRGHGGRSGPLGWQLAFPYVQWQLYQFYGDKRIIEENYQRVTKQLEFLNQKAIDGLFHWDISDHEAIDPRPEAFTASAFYYHHALLAKEFALILEKNDDAKIYGQLANRIKDRIVNKYYVPGTGRFDNATQSAQLFSLWYNLSPDPDLSFEVLLNEFKRHHDHVSAGIFGVMMMWDVLRERNRNDLAYKIATQPDYPGWGYMLAKGATTLWETWQYSDNVYSLNHPMFGSTEEWFYRSLLGINSIAPGFSKVMIKPQPAGDLTWAKGTYHSINGPINVSWKMDQQNYTLEVAVPANVKAQIWLKAKEGSAIFVNEREMNNVVYQDGYAIVETGSGRYQFQCVNNKK